MVLLNGIIRASRSSRPLPRYLSTLHTAPCPTIDNKQWNDEHDNRIQLRQYQQPINIINTSLPSNGIIRRDYHATPSRDRAAAIIMGFGALAAAAKAGQYAAQGYNEWKEERDAAAEELEKWKKENPEAAAEQEAAAKAEEEASSSSTSSSSSSTGGAEEATASGTGGAAAGGAKQKEGKRENIFASFFNMSVGSKYYEGGFEDTMTRKEAALILGVRESSAAKRIKEAHRKLLVLNHPDTGGSTFMAGKINEAKELLLKGRKM